MDDKLLTAIWIIVCATVLVALLMITSCVHQEDVINGKISVECLKHGGNYEYLAGSDTAKACKMK